MSTSQRDGHSSPITIADLHDVLADLLAAVMAAHPDPIHAAYPPIARAIIMLRRYDEQQTASLSRETHATRAE